MADEQYGINHNNIIIIPTVGVEKVEPPAKKPKLDSTPEKDAIEKCAQSITSKQPSPTKDASKDSIKSDGSSVVKETKVQSWASNYLNYLQSIGKARMSLSMQKNVTKMAEAQPNPPVTQTNIANTSNWAPMNLPTRYLPPDPLNYRFQMQTSINPTQNTCCCGTSLNYTGPINYTSPINYNPPINYDTPVNYSAPQNYATPQNYSAAINYTASLNYNVPLNYPTPTNDTAPINYNAPLNYNAPINYSTPLDNTALTNYNAPLNYTMPSNEPLTLLNEPITSLEDPRTPLIDEPNSPINERASPLNESISPLLYEPISPSSESTTPTNSAENERLANDSIKSKEVQLPEVKKGTSETNITPKTKIKLNLIRKKTDRYKKNNSVNVHEQRDKCKTHGIGRNMDENIQSEIHTKRSGFASNSKDKVVDTHKSRSLKPVPKLKYIGSCKSVKETSKPDYSRKDRQKKLLSEHHKYQETESHKKRDTKENSKHDNNNTKIIENMKEIRALYEKAKSAYNKKHNDCNKPSTSKIRRSRTPEPVHRKRPRTDSGNADKDRSMKNTSPLKSIVQPINKIKYPTTSISTSSHPPEENDAEVPQHFDLRSKLSRANRYFHNNRHSQDNLKDRDNLVVTINQPVVKTEPKPKSPPKVTVTEKKIKSKNNKYKTIKFTIKVLCQDGEGSASSHSDDSEEELNAGEVASSQNDLSFLDDFNVDEIVDSLKSSQKRNVNMQNKNKSSHIKNTVPKNNKLGDNRLIDDIAILEPPNDHKTQVIKTGESIDCIIVEDTINTENIKIEQKYDSNINASNNCAILDTVGIGNVKSEVFAENNESNDCVILDASIITTTIKTEQDNTNESNESCNIMDNTIDIISIKSESNDSAIDIKPNIEIQSEALVKSNDCIVVEIENHPIKIEDSSDSIMSELDNAEAHNIKTKLNNIDDEMENVTNIYEYFAEFNENLNNSLYDEDTMEIPQLAQELMYVDEIKNTEVVDNITNNNCYPELSATAIFELTEPEHREFEIPIVSETVASNVEKTVFNIDNNETTETVYEDIEQDVSKISDAININVVEIPNIIKKEPTVTSPTTRDNIEIVDTINIQDTNQHVQKTDSNTKVIKMIEIPVIKEKLFIVSPVKKDPLNEIIPTQNVEMNINEVSQETKTGSEKNTSTKSDSPKKADTEKHENLNNIETLASKILEPVIVTKENINSAHENDTKKKREPIIYISKPEGLTTEKAIKQEIINNIEPELAHLKLKDSQAIINAVAGKAEEIINTTKPETSTLKSKDTSKVISPVATKSVETENRQVVIVKKNDNEELGEIKEQLESRIFEYLHERYTITLLLHEGRFSKIFKCNDSKDRNYVVKLLKSPNDRVGRGLEKENILQKVQREIPKENLNIVRVINGFGFERRWAFIMDYYPHNLLTVLHERKKGFSVHQLPDLARQLIMAVMVLRNNEIVHSDIKPSHILVDESGQRLKLCGFDSCYYSHPTDVLPNIGTSSYRAPEIIMGFSASFSIDVWATGVVLYEIFTKRKLFPTCFNNQILFAQLCLFGDLPPDMIHRSRFQNKHFDGRSFVRRFGNGGMKREIIHEFTKTQRLYNLLLSSYNHFWGRSNKKSRREDLSKLHCFYELLEKMLVLDPRHRLPIEFVCADPFINEFQ